MARLPSMTSNPRHIPQSRKRFAHQWNACIDSMSVLICTHDEERLSLSLKCPFSSPSLQFASTRSLAALSTTFTNCARQRICHGGFSKQPVTPDPAKRCSDRYHFLVTAFSDISSEQSILLLRKQLIRPRSRGATARGPPFLPGNEILTRHVRGSIGAVPASPRMYRISTLEVQTFDCLPNGTHRVPRCSHPWRHMDQTTET